METRQLNNNLSPKVINNKFILSLIGFNLKSKQDTAKILQLRILNKHKLI